MYLLGECRDKLIKSIILNIPIDAIDPDFISGLEKVSSARGNVLFNFNIFDPANNISLGLLSRHKTIKITDDLLEFVDSRPGVEITLK